MRTHNPYWISILKIAALLLVLALAYGMDRWMASQTVLSLITLSARGVVLVRLIAGISLGIALLGLTWLVVLYRKTTPLVGWVYLILGLFLNAMPLLLPDVSSTETLHVRGPLGWVRALVVGDFFTYTCIVIPFVGLFSLIVKRPPGPGRD
jgi:hypothetical protein